ncbi:hypothetical protein [Luteibacter sp.]|uniref:hypothetical protein n=1 Tax=Luteibacter sp. TaxID=1886636 RepID=UPI003F7D5598
MAIILSRPSRAPSLLFSTAFAAVVGSQVATALTGAVFGPALVAHLMYGTGRANLAQGAVFACQGLEAALSPALGGWMAELYGFTPAFLCLGTFSAFAVAIWLFARPELAGTALDSSTTHGRSR